MRVCFSHRANQRRPCLVRLGGPSASSDISTSEARVECGPSELRCRSKRAAAVRGAVHSSHTRSCLLTRSPLHLSPLSCCRRLNSARSTLARSFRHSQAPRERSLSHLGKRVVRHSYSSHIHCPTVRSHAHGSESREEFVSSSRAHAPGRWQSRLIGRVWRHRHLVCMHATVAAATDRRTKATTAASLLHCRHEVTASSSERPTTSSPSSPPTCPQQHGFVPLGRCHPSSRSQALLLLC